MYRPFMAGTAFPVRYRLVGWLTTGSMINSLDRVNIAVATPVMMESLGWDEGRFGGIFSAFLVVPEPLRIAESDPSVLNLKFVA